MLTRINTKITYREEINFNERIPVFPREHPLISIVIINYNYEKYLPRAIDSALHQTYPFKEIIVVDDGSTDNSRTIIKKYGSQVTVVFQENRGAVSATNTGFFTSKGEIVFFLDSDDIFSPHKVAEMVNYYLQVVHQNQDVMIFHRLKTITEKGVLLKTVPQQLRTVDRKRKAGSFEKLSDPESAYRHIQKWGFLPFMASPTSGLSLTRSLARKIFPLPEKRDVVCQDRLLICCAMLLGTVYGSSQVLGSHIIHGDNISFVNKFGSQNDINFVNDILQKANKKRIASFHDTRYAKADYVRCGAIGGLLKLSYMVPARYFCWETIWFSLKTLWLCSKLVLGIKKGSRLTKTNDLFIQAKSESA